MATVLIVDDNEIFCEMLSDMVNDLGHQVTSSYTMKDGLEKAASELFDIIFLDIRLPDGNGLEALPTIHGMPSAPLVIIITGAGDPDGADLAIKNGAWDYIEKQTPLRQIALSLTRAAQFKQEINEKSPVDNARLAKLGKVIGFVGAKGGVGTTTVTINIASALAQKKKNVIAIELIPCRGTFSLIMNQPVTQNLADLLALETESITPAVIEKFLYSSGSGLRILFGPQQVDEMRKINPDLIAALIKGLASLADYILIDLPSDDIGICYAAAKCCDQVILVTEREQFSVRSGKTVSELLTSWGISKNLIGIVITTRIILPITMKIESIKSHLDFNIIGTVPYSVEACSLSQISGQPIVLFQPDNIAAISLIDMADKIA